MRQPKKWIRNKKNADPDLKKYGTQHTVRYPQKYGTQNTVRYPHKYGPQNTVRYPQKNTVTQLTVRYPRVVVTIYR